MREHVAALERDTFAVLQQAKRVFPNLRIAYLGSRTYGGYASGPLNPEPYAFEGAFAVRGLIARQERGEAELALTKSPLLLWGPYLWAEWDAGTEDGRLAVGTQRFRRGRGASEPVRAARGRRALAGVFFYGRSGGNVVRAAVAGAAGAAGQGRCGPR